MLGTDTSAKGGISSVVRDYFEFGLMSRLNVEYVATYRDGSKSSKVLFFLRQFPKIVSRMISADIVHAHSAHGWSFRRLASLLYLAKILGKKTVLHSHGSDFHIYYDNASRIERALIRYSLRNTDTVIVLSQDWKKKLTEIEPAGNYHVVRNGVDSNKYQVDARVLHNPVKVLFLGELGERKGVYDLVRAAQILNGSGFAFVLAGNGDVDGVRTMVRELELDETVSTPGWIGPEEKQRLLREADVYVLPSYNEGLPISILEAMAAGLPVVSTPVGGIPEAVIEGRNGFLVSPGDASSLADCIHKATSDGKSWKEMSEISSAMARESFSMEMVEGELRKIYGSMISIDARKSASSKSMRPDGKLEN